ncbi:MAG: hypothetical protein AAF626_18095 [Pseudomonadota bacterium]
MFKTALTAAAFAITATFAHASGAPISAAPEGVIPTQELAAYCEWVTVYDYWGNWFTVWQCY